MSQANQELNLALSNATAIGEMAKTARIQSQNILNESYALIERHNKFLNPTGIQSADVAIKVEEVKIITNTSYLLFKCIQIRYIQFRKMF